MYHYDFYNVQFESCMGFWGDDVKVYEYGYRRAMARNVIFTCEDCTSVYVTQKNLADMCNTRPDNHQTFLIKKGDWQIVVRFSDNKMYVGTKLEICGYY